MANRTLRGSCSHGLVLHPASLLHRIEGLFNVFRFPPSGASEPLTDVAAFNESAGIFIDRVTDGPFLWLHRFVSPAIAVWLPWVFWTTVLYMLSALLHRPRSVFRRSSSTQ